MKQVSQPIHGGGPRVVTVPAPSVRAGGVLIRTHFSLVSAGTDRMILKLAGQSLAGKARSRPDQARQVLRKLRSEGLRATVDAVRSKLGSALPLGYSASGRVVALGSGVTDLRVGQAVACAGMGYASHAECIFVPRNLVAPVPEGLGLREASTVTLGAIALQGVRRADVRLGERVGVIGLGIIGLLTVQMLRASGCHVIAVDLDPSKVELSKRMGAEVAATPGSLDLESSAEEFGEGHGLDCVIVTAGSKSSEPTITAARMCRLGGRVVVVGAVGMDLPRRILYDRELDLRLARSYGPGRYDAGYEEKGIDYPYPWVRFTEGRNMAEYLSLLGRDVVEVDDLLTHEFEIAEGEDAYRFLMSDEGSAAIGLLFRYESDETDAGNWKPGKVHLRARRSGAGGTGVGLVGAGGFARAVLLPILSRLPDFRPTGVATATGLSAVTAGRSAGFAFATTRIEDVLDDPDTEAVVIATRHGDHARLAVDALRAGKDVFLEKPLALDLDELRDVTAAVEETKRLLMVGFNRRFAPTYVRARERVSDRSGPIQMLYRVNAGPMPAGHWTLDPREGGGRILGEGCHFVDLMCHLAGCVPVRVTAESLPGDGLSGTIRFADGSVGTLVYAVSGDPGSGKERLEVFGGGTSAILDNYRSLRVSSGGRFRRVRATPGKGHREEVRAFLDAVRSGGASPVPFEQAAWSTRTTFALVAAAASGRAVDPGDPG